MKISNKKNQNGVSILQQNRRLDETLMITFVLIKIPVSISNIFTDQAPKYNFFGHSFFLIFEEFILGVRNIE